MTNDLHTAQVGKSGCALGGAAQRPYGGAGHAGRVFRLRYLAKVSEKISAAKRDEKRSQKARRKILARNIRASNSYGTAFLINLICKWWKKVKQLFTRQKTISELWVNHAKRLNRPATHKEVVKATLIESGGYRNLLTLANSHAASISLGPYFTMKDAENWLLSELRFRVAVEAGIIGQ